MKKIMCNDTMFLKPHQYRFIQGYMQNSGLGGKMKNFKVLGGQWYEGAEAV